MPNALPTGCSRTKPCSDPMTASRSFPMERLDALLIEAVREACLLESALEREMAALSGRDLDTLNEPWPGSTRWRNRWKA